MKALTRCAATVSTGSPLRYTVHQQGVSATATGVGAAVGTFGWHAAASAIAPPMQSAGSVLEVFIGVARG